MTSEEFEARYELRDCVSSAGIRSYEAIARPGSKDVSIPASGTRPVMAHFLEGPPAENHELLTLLTALEPDYRAQVVETLEVEGTIVVVTEVLADFTELGEWLRSGARQADAGPASPGEFTRLFGPAAEAVSEPPEQPVDAAGGTEDTTQLVEPPAEKAPPGEFTRVFEREPEPDAGVPTGEAETALPAEPAAEARPPSEFTRLFGRQKDRSPGEAGVDEAPSGKRRRRKPRIRWRDRQPAEDRPAVKPVVRLKKKGPPEADLPADPEVIPPEEPKRQAEPGEFTRVFGGKAGSPEPPPGPAEAPGLETSAYVEMLRTPAAPKADRPAAGVPAVRATPPRDASPPLDLPPVGAPPVSAEPGEFTRVVSARPPPAGPPPPEAAQPEPVPSLRRLLVGLGVIVGLVVALVIVFALL